MTSAVPALGEITDGATLQEWYRDAPVGIRANMIFSADGAAAFRGRAGPLSCPADQQLLRDLRAYADVILVGAGTVRAENYGPVRLTDGQRAERAARGLTDVPPLAVVSQTGVLPETLFADPDQQHILITSARGAARHDLHSDHRRRVLVAGAEEVDLAEAAAELAHQGMPRILCEGGPTVLQRLVEEDLVDEICVTLAPYFAGSQPTGAAPASGLPIPTALEMAHILVHGGYVFLRYHRRETSK
jgi:riboflavin biosynthesis pyrimidine reductase